MSNQPKVYVASSLSNWKRVRSICDKIKSLGAKITYDWSQWGEDIFGEGTEINPDGIKPEDKLVDIAIAEVKGVEDADVVLAVMPGERGSHFEMAIAWHTKTPVVILTDGETAQRPTSFHLLPRIERINNEQEAIDRTIEIAKAFNLVDKFSIEETEDNSTDLPISSCLCRSTRA